MPETWEQAKIERLETRVERLEQENWERSERIFRWVMYGYMVIIAAFVIAAVTIGASHHAH